MSSFFVCEHVFTGYVLRLTRWAIINNANRTLGDIEKSLSEITDRTWYTVIFFVLHDRQNVLDNIQKLDEAVVLFQVSQPPRSLAVPTDIDSGSWFKSSQRGHHGDDAQTRPNVGYSQPNVTQA
jgi:hypothetical protein